MVRRSVLPSVLVVLLCSCALDTGVGVQEEAVVFGVDDRTEVFARADDVITQIARSSVAMQIEARMVDTSAAPEVRISSMETLAATVDLCEGESFYSQPSVGTCSGTLIDSQHILTAGHCVRTMEDCTGWDWVFGWHYESDGVLRTLRSDDHYRCTGIVVNYEVADVDYAVITLDRPVIGHDPVPVRTTFTPLPDGTALTMIGHPEGIPMKITAGAQVISWSPLGHDLVADLDAFSGNSGSGIFSDDGVLVGILVTGEDDYEMRGGCQVVRVVDSVEPGGGEGVTAGVSALEDYCRADGTSTACPAGGVEMPPAERPARGGGRGGRGCSVGLGRVPGGLGWMALAACAAIGRRRRARG